MTTKYMIVSALCAAGGAYVTFLIYRWRARVDLDKKREEARIDLDTKKESVELQNVNLPVQILRDELEKKEEELATIRAEDKAERIAAQAERMENLKTLNAMQGALETIATELKASREDGRQHASNVHKRIDTLDDRLLVIETELAIRKREKA